MHCSATFLPAPTCTRKYEIELSNGTTQEYYANVIAESMISQVDGKGQDYLLMNNEQKRGWKKDPWGGVVE